MRTHAVNAYSSSGVKGLSTCGHTATIAEPLVLHSQPLKRATCDRTGNAELGAFAFQRQGAQLTQLMGECRRRTRNSDAAHDPSGAALCRDRSEPAIDPPCDWLTKRAPGSLNAPPLARSRPTQVFQGCRLAENSMMWGVTGSPLRPQM
jgi:hypothetical protein